MPFKPTDYLPYDFANRRHIGPSPAEIAEMLKVVGASSLDDLIDQTVPASIRQAEPLDFGRPMSERQFLWHIRQIAKKNRVFSTMIGQGYHGTVTPPAIQRNILENPAWYTAYTPYQPEISQGRLEALLNYQTMVCDLTGLDIANASLLDEATAAPEAMAMAQRVSKSKSRTFFIDENCHPSEHRGDADPGRAPGAGGDRRRSGRDAVRGGFRRDLSISGHLRGYLRFHRPDCGSARDEGAWHCYRRSAGADAAQGTGCHGGRHCRRFDPALWRAHGLWWAARGLYGLPRCAQAPPCRGGLSGYRSMRAATRPIA